MDFYVLGSGATLSHIDPAFFDGKHVVATNLVGQRLGLYERDCQRLFTHSHYHQDTYQLAEQHPHFFFWTPEGDQGFPGTPGRTDLVNVVHYPHQPTTYDFNVDKAWPADPSGLLVGSTSVHGSMHLACKFGASTLILIGVDCGLLDGQANHAGYQSGNLASGNQLAWLARWEQHLQAVSNKLRRRYGVRIYSLLPFQNLNLEGHHWQGVSQPHPAGESH